MFNEWYQVVHKYMQMSSSRETAPALQPTQLGGAVDPDKQASKNVGIAREKLQKGQPTFTIHGVCVINTTAIQIPNSYYSDPVCSIDNKTSEFINAAQQLEATLTTESRGMMLRAVPSRLHREWAHAHELVLHCYESVHRSWSDMP